MSPDYKKLENSDFFKKRFLFCTNNVGKCGAAKEQCFKFKIEGEISFCSTFKAQETGNQGYDQTMLFCCLLP